MSFAFVGNNNAVGTGVTSLSCNRPAGTAVGNLIVALYAFEGVAAGSGPWIIPNSGQFSLATGRLGSTFCSRGRRRGMGRYSRFGHDSGSAVCGLAERDHCDGGLVG